LDLGDSVSFAAKLLHYLFSILLDFVLAVPSLSSSVPFSVYGFEGSSIFMLKSTMLDLKASNVQTIIVIVFL
jgi:hypothetical protein